MRAPAQPRGKRPTLESFADLVGLSIEFLREHHVREIVDDHGRQPVLEYRSEFGGIVGQKVRLSLEGEPKYSWLIKGKSGHVYGEWKLEWIRGLRYVVFVEGETDALVLWANLFAALGISGASNADKIEVDHLVGLDTIYIVEEPGKAGASFVEGLARRARELGFKGAIRSLRMPGGAKDPCELHRQAPDDFKARFATALETAGAVSTHTADAAVAGARRVIAFPGSASSGLDRKPPAGLPLTELGNSERFVALFGDRARYCHSWGVWLHWNGKQWLEDVDSTVRGWAKHTVRAIHREAADEDNDERRRQLGQWAMKSEKRAMLEAMLHLAQPELPVRPEELDGDRWLLNCVNGTVDLRTGELRAHRHEDYITRLVPVDYSPEAAAPTWERFLSEIMGGSKPLVAFLRRAIGYSLSGDTSERVLFILWGAGANGKTTFLETLRRLLDRYGLQTSADVLMAERTDRGGGASPDLARLKGARFVIASETDDGRRLAEARVKAITGREAITARRLYADTFEFVPEFKVWLATNHKPVIRGNDHGIWSRIRLVPFTPRTFADGDQDKKLPEKLEAEWPGILAWAVRGCLDWQRDGLGTSDEVRDATKVYREEMDTLGAFLGECCAVKPSHWVPSSDLWSAFEAWCQRGNERAGTLKEFSLRLSERGFEAGKVRHVRGWHGLGLLASGDGRDGSGRLVDEKNSCIPHEGKFAELPSQPSQPSPAAEREEFEL